MIKLKLNFILIFIFKIPFFFSLKYPINQNIVNSTKLSSIRTIELFNINDIYNLTQNNKYVIIIFYQDWCKQSKKIIPIFDEVSKYEIMKNIKFIKINCLNKTICDFYNIQKYPTTKIFINNKEFKYEPEIKLSSFLEDLKKISSNPLILINSKNDFYKQYGTFSPYVEYKKENNSFINCLTKLTNEYYLSNFYFGLKKIKENEEEKIEFNYNNIIINHKWDENCDKLNEFLSLNIYPLINEINNEFISEILKSPKIAIILLIFTDNENQINFINNEFKQISFENRNYIFGYADIDKKGDFVQFFNPKSSSINMKLIIFDFINSRYYIHNKELDVNKKPKERTVAEINYLIENINKLHFHSGDFLEELFRFLDINLTPKEFMIFICFFIVCLTIACLSCVLFCNFDNDKDEKKIKKHIKNINHIKKE
jgi:thiol-disulfide isomerase/thioredoxin